MILFSLIRCCCVAASTATITEAPLLRQLDTATATATATATSTSTINTLRIWTSKPLDLGMTLPLLVDADYDEEEHQYALERFDNESSSTLEKQATSCDRDGSSLYYFKDNIVGDPTVYNEDGADIDHLTQQKRSWLGPVRDLALEVAGRSQETYIDFLERHPSWTKSITACLIGGLGDILAQIVESGFFSVPDVRRILAVATEGLLISGPLMHHGYEFLEYILPLEGEEENNKNNNDDNDNNNNNTYSSLLHNNKWLTCILQVLIDALIMDCVFVATLMITTAILEGRPIPSTRVEYWDGIRVSWCSSAFFAPIQCFLFRYVPLPFRVMAMNIQDVFWNAAVSYVAHAKKKRGEDEMISIVSI